MDLLSNISERRAITLTNVQYSSNDYNNYPDEVRLEGSDSIDVKDVKETGFLISLSRSIKSPDNNVFSFFVSYDIEYTFIEPYKNVDSISAKDLKKLICDNQELLCGCLAKISLIISQISAQLGDGVPIVSPLNLMI